MTHLPEYLSVDGLLELTNCTALKHLPKSLRVGHSLELTNCKSLTELPDGLIFNWFLDLRGCTALTALPNGLIVRGWFNLKDCTLLTALPADLKVGDRIYLNHPLDIPDKVQCPNFVFRGIKHFPREYISNPELITDEVIKAAINPQIQAMLIEMMDV